jgi:anthranilate phosphoribosyltransferase
MSDVLKPFLAQLSHGHSLNQAQAYTVFSHVMAGGASAAQIGALLMALRLKGETIDELAGATQVLRENVQAITAPPDAIDCCGTGGDAQGGFNVSTATAFVVAGCGVAVAKHGNRALTSRSGAADVLRALGVRIDPPPSLVETGLWEDGICFLFAPQHHAAIRHVMPARGELGFRTIFNLLGPLANPAGVKRQLLGVFDRQWTRPLALVLGKLGAQHVWVVHGEDGSDELTTAGVSYVAEWRENTLHEFTLTPEDIGLKRVDKSALAGGSPDENASLLREILAGKSGPLRESVCLNAAGALIIAGKVKTLHEGLALARQALDSGAALHKLALLIKRSQFALNNDP